MLGRPPSVLIPGPAGQLEVVVEVPDTPRVRGWALLGHPHPQMGGTLDNKVVHTLVRACLSTDWAAIRFNFRGVGRSQGQWDQGQGELDDMLAVWEAFRGDARWAGLPGWLGGFSFGGHIAVRAASQLAAAGAAPAGLLLVSPAVSRFETPAVPVPALVVEGDQDDVVPLSAVLDWARPQAQPVTVVPGAGHFFHGQLGLLKQLVARHIAFESSRHEPIP